MEEDSIIQGQTILEVLFALFLTLVTTYAYISCRAYGCRMDAADAKLAAARLKTLPVSRSAERHFCSPSPHPIPLEKFKSWMGDWLAPIVVWSAVIWTMLSIVMILLGES
jgi:hypothetical protein